jgi:hypothetical protein
MRSRIWLTGLLLLGVFAAVEPAPVHAAIWPFSLFAKKAPAKKAKSKKGKPAYGTRVKAAKPAH